MYHAFARSAGLPYWPSLGYAIGGSALWEIAGESLFRLASLTLEHDNLPNWWRETAATLISPSTGFNRLAFGERFRAVFPSNGAIRSPSRRCAG
jgi:hypothetical protein